MRCSHCDSRVGGILGTFRSRGLRCPNPECAAVVCADCIPELTETFEEGFGPLRKTVLEIVCPECKTGMFRQEFESEIVSTMREIGEKARAKAEEKAKTLGSMLWRHLGNRVNRDR